MWRGTECARQGLERLFPQKSPPKRTLHTISPKRTLHTNPCQSSKEPRAECVAMCCSVLQCVAVCCSEHWADWARCERQRSRIDPRVRLKPPTFCPKGPYILPKRTLYANTLHPSGEPWTEQAYCEWQKPQKSPIPRPKEPYILPTRALYSNPWHLTWEPWVDPTRCAWQRSQNQPYILYQNGHIFRQRRSLYSTRALHLHIWQLPRELWGLSKEPYILPKRALHSHTWQVPRELWADQARCGWQNPERTLDSSQKSPTFCLKEPYIHTPGNRLESLEPIRHVADGKGHCCSIKLVLRLQCLRQILCVALLCYTDICTYIFTCAIVAASNVCCTLSVCYQSCAPCFVIQTHKHIYTHVPLLQHQTCVAPSMSATKLARLDKTCTSTCFVMRVYMDIYTRIYYCILEYTRIYYCILESRYMYIKIYVHLCVKISSYTSSWFVIQGGEDS